MNGIVYTQSAYEAEYPKGHWAGAVSVTKVRNAMRKAGYELVNAENDSVNRVRVGMTGFVKHPDGRLVYVSQDCSESRGGQFLYRAARHDRDWAGGRNNFCEPSDLVRSVKSMFDHSPDSWDRNF